MLKNDQHQILVSEYMCHFNITKAARTAGTTADNAYKILKRPEVRAEINRIKEERAAINEDKRDQLINALERIAYADITDFLTFDDNGVAFLDSSKIDGELIAEIGMTTTDSFTADGEERKKVKKKIKFVDKIKALEMLSKHHGILNDSVNVNGKVAIQIIDDIGALNNDKA